MSGNVGRVLSLSGSTDVDTASTWLVAAETVVDVAGVTAARDRVAEHLAAHFVEVGPGQVKASERLPDWSASYMTAAGLRSTRNGQIAVALAPSLGELGLRRPSLAVMEAR